MPKQQFPDSISTKVDGQAMFITDANGEFLSAFSMKALANALTHGDKVSAIDRANAGAFMMHFIALQRDTVAMPNEAYNLALDLAQKKFNDLKDELAKGQVGESSFSGRATSDYTEASSMKVYIGTITDVEEDKSGFFVARTAESAVAKLKAWVASQDYDFGEAQTKLDACKTIKALREFFYKNYDRFNIGLETQDLED